MPETAHEILETLLSDNSLNDDQDLMSRIAPPDLRLSQSLEFLDEVQLESAALYDDFEFDTPKADQEEVTESDVDHDILRRLIEDLLGAKRHKTLAPSVTATPDENPQVFQKILRVSDELYVTFEKIFAENGMHSLPCTGHKQTESRNMVGDGVFLEIMHQNFVPFNFRETERVVWVCLSEIGMRSLEGVRDYNKEVSFHAQHLEKDNNTMVTSYFAATTGVPAVSGAQFQKVLRKYIEENRAVFVCQTEMEPKLEGSGASIGVRFYTTLIVVVESGASINGSLDIGIAAWEAMICRVSDALESFLVDNAVGAFTIE
ncbi:hypothetical protein JG687_00008823 [Phytophthora cactorum]|uniref:Uncharacterized protein n=1 Tax=Phytophthora cactorum TaxID=29920 RepID=A0A8T1UGF0_9STRA|nr:hypothetical protein JG687_00008823 [Phytophthora cactorum]